MAAVALAAAAALILAGPWSESHRLVFACCVVVTFGLVASENLVPWESLPSSSYSPMPAMWLLVIGAVMWVSGGWSNPFTAFLALPVAYAVTITSIRRAVPIGVIAGVLAASPSLYVPGGSFLLVAAGSVPAYVALVWMVGVIVGNLRRSDQIAALEAESRRQSESREMDLLTLHRISSIVAQHLSMDEAISSIVRELSTAFGHSLVSLYLFDGVRLCMQAQIGYATYFETMEPGQGVIGNAFTSGKTIFIPDVSLDGAYLLAHGTVLSEIAVPIRDEGRVVAVLNIESSEMLGERDRDLMELFGLQVAVVLRNAQFAGELRLRAEHDPLTGLLNRGAILEILERKLAMPDVRCAVLVIDFDDFKQINDTRGHLTGDAVLAHLAGILKDCCREDDFCSRLGGDEFVIVLANAGSDQAAGVARRISAAVTKQPYAIEGNNDIPLLLSIGIAIAPDDGTTREELLASADRAMYTAKRAVNVEGAPTPA